MVLRTQLMHGVDQHAQVIRVDVGRDAVAEIEHVTGPATVARQHICDAKTIAWSGFVPCWIASIMSRNSWTDQRILNGLPLSGRVKPSGGH